MRHTISREYRIKPISIKPLSGGTRNKNFLVTAEEGRFVIRIYPNSDPKNSAIERQMLNTLSSSRFPCPHPLYTIRRKNWTLVNGCVAILYPFIEGKTKPKSTIGVLRQLGDLQGRMHVILRKTRPAVKKEGWDLEQIKRLLKTHRRDILHGAFPRANALLDFLDGELSTISLPTGLPKGLTHQDIKPENVIAREDKIVSIIDFDNGYYGELLHDITTTIIWWACPKQRLDTKLAHQFIQAYEKKRKLTPLERNALYGEALRFRLLREMLIWPMRVQHDVPQARKQVEKFMHMYRNLFGRGISI